MHHKSIKKSLQCDLSTTIQKQELISYLLDERKIPTTLLNRRNKILNSKSSKSLTSNSLIQTPNNVGIYLRCSTIDQSEAFSLELQKATCKKYIDFKEWNLIKTYSDVISGSTPIPKRPNLTQLIIDAIDNHIDTVIVYSVDRLARSSSIVTNFLSMLNSLNIHFISCRENIDTDSIGGKFMIQFMSSVAEMELDLIRERVTNGMAQRKELDGETGQTPPYGYKRISTGVKKPSSTFIINDEEAHNVRLIFYFKDIYRPPINPKTLSRYRQPGWSKIAQTFDLYLIPTRKTTSSSDKASPDNKIKINKWAPTTIRQIYLSNKSKYLGGTRGTSNIYSWPIILNNEMLDPNLIPKMIW